MQLDCLEEAEVRQGWTGRRLNGLIVTIIGKAVVTGHWQPGEVLPNEIEASRQLRVSRTTYREAIRTLVGKGLLECRPQSGVRVLERSHWRLFDPDVVAWVFAGRVEGKFLQDMSELRLAIEPEAAAMAAVRRTDEDLRILRECAQEISNLNAFDREWGMPRRLANFHFLMLRSAHNGMLTTMAAGIRTLIGHSTYHGFRAQRLQEGVCPVIDALDQQDPSAASRAMQTLIVTGQERSSV